MNTTRLLVENAPAALKMAEDMGLQPVPNTQNVDGVKCNVFYARGQDSELTALAAIDLFRTSSDFFAMIDDEMAPTGIDGTCT